MRWSLVFLLLLPMVGGQMPLDAEAPSLEFVMNKEQGNALEGTIYHYELHPVGAHEPLNGKYYGSSQVEIDGFTQFVLTMPYANPEEVPLTDGEVNGSFAFGVTNRGSGTYEASWRLLADATLVAEGEARSFQMEGQQTDVGTAWVTWQTPALIDAIPQGAELRLELDVSFSGNAPFIKDRGIILDLPGLRQPAAEPAMENETTAPETAGPAEDDFVETGPTDQVSPGAMEGDDEVGADERDGRSEPRDLDWLWLPVIVLVGIAAIIIIQRRG